MTMVVEKATALELPPITFVEEGRTCDHKTSRCCICLPQAFPEVIVSRGGYWRYPPPKEVYAYLAAQESPPKALKLHRSAL